MNRELLKLKKMLIKNNVQSKEDAIAEALSKLIRETREGLIEINDFINEFSKFKKDEEGAIAYK